MTNQVNVTFTNNMKVKDIKQALGGDLSTKNSKMPGSTFGLSTSGCAVGQALQQVEGSVCSRCYAAKLEKLRPSVKLGWQRRTDAVLDAIADREKRTAWITGMAQRIHMVADKTGERFHRWHDSGDLQGIEHLNMIVMVALATPSINHWLPTKEKATIKRYLKIVGKFPANLVVRVSSAMIGAEPVAMACGTSTVHRKGEAHHGRECPAYKQGGNCGECRACWDANVQNVSYPLH